MLSVPTSIPSQQGVALCARSCIRPRGDLLDIADVSSGFALYAATLTCYAQIVVRLLLQHGLHVVALLHQERLATAEERGALQAQVLREELAAVRLQLAAECDRRAAAEQRVADATGRELRELHTQARPCCVSSRNTASCRRLAGDRFRG